MKTGHVEKTIDRDYELEERRYRTMESAANKLQKEAKGYLDSLRGTQPHPGRTRPSSTASCIVVCMMANHLCRDSDDSGTDSYCGDY
jgi:hypothetical protein